MTTPGSGAERPSRRTLVIIPTYNERENIATIIGRLHAALPKANVLVVDDGSPDGTGKIADALAATALPDIDDALADAKGAADVAIRSGPRTTSTTRACGR